MGAKTYWIEENVIMSADYEGNVSTKDIDQIMEACMGVVEKHPCYFLVDTLKMHSIQPSFLKLNSLLKFIGHPNLRWLAMVIEHNPMIRFAVQVLVRKNASVFSTREDALAYLQKRIELDKATHEIADQAIA